MAKESKINPYILFGVSAALLSAALLMRSFPVLIFAAIAPLFAITDHATEKNFWNKAELVMVVFGIGLLIQHQFHTSMSLVALLEPIAIGLVFVAYTYSKRGLGNQLGKLTLILFWLAMEYVFLKFLSQYRVFFVGDALTAKADWMYWTNWTGHVGGSLWVLVANWLLYLGLFRNGLRVSYLVLFLIVIVGPILYSYSLRTDFATRANTLHGEWIPRTAAWISVLILLSAFVKDNIRKK